MFEKVSIPIRIFVFGPLLICLIVTLVNKIIHLFLQLRIGVEVDHTTENCAIHHCVQPSEQLHEVCYSEEPIGIVNRAPFAVQDFRSHVECVDWVHQHIHYEKRRGPR